MAEVKSPQKRSLYGATAIMASATFLSRILGLAREQVWYPYTADTAKQLQNVMRWAFGTRIGRWLT